MASQPVSFDIHPLPSPLHPLQEAEDMDAEQTERQTTITLPYIQGLSEPIKRILEKLEVSVRLCRNVGSLLRMLQ